MCRCGNEDAGRCALYYARGRKEPLRIRAFYVRLSGAGRGPQHHAAPETLMLVYLPRINGVALEVNGARVRADRPAFVALHRVRAAESGGDLVYGSTDRVRAGEGVRFEAYIGEERALKGSFRRREDGGWRMECSFVAAASGVAEAEVCVAGEGNLLMRERMEVAATRRRFCSGLEDIPEELGEGEGCCDCCEDEWEVLETSEGSDSEEEEEEEEEECGEKSWKKEGEGEEEAEESPLEGVRWAVDLGIWAVCLGVGLLVSKASYKRRRSGSLLSF